MNGDLQQILAERLSLTGVAAWGLHTPDRSVTSHCASEWFTAQSVEDLLRRLVFAADGLRAAELRPLRMCWVFERGQLHLATRADGLALGVFVEERPDADTPAVVATLEEFSQADAR